MKSASKLFLGVVCLALVAGMASAQATVLQEDFSTATGNLPPAGWTSITNIATNGPEEWRFDDPGGRGTPSAMSAPVAVFDDDALSASGAMSDAELISPVFNTSALGTVLLQFETKFIDLATSTIRVDVFNGTVWNNVFNHTAPDIPVGALIGDATSETQVIDITAAAGGSSQARVRFHWTLGSWDWYWQVDDVTVFEPSPNMDVGVATLITPNSGSGALLCGPYTNNETVQIAVSNFAFATVPAGTMIPVQHDVDGSNFVGETMTTAGPLAFGQTENYTFTTGADLTVSPGPFVVTATTLLMPDANVANDAASNMVPVAGGGVPQALPFSEDFGTLVGNGLVPPGWVQDQTENDASDLADDWWFGNNGTPSGVGPTADATTGNGMTSFAFIEDTSFGTDAAAISLVTPCLDLTTTTAPVLSFEVWSSDAFTAPNTLDVDVIAYPGGITPMVLPTIGDLATPSWVNQNANLSAFVGTVIRIVFRGRNDNGDFGHDISIDDVFVFDPVPSLGQPSTPGFGTLDINGSARNGANLGVQSGAGGAYYVSLSISAGDSLGIEIGGEPIAGLASILFIGRTLEAAIPIVPFGTVDLDPTDMTLPIGIIGNGFAAPLNFYDTLFFTNVNGEINITLPLTAQLMGLSPFGLSAINLTPNNGGITITNTADVTINP